MEWNDAVALMGAHSIGRGDNDVSILLVFSKMLVTVSVANCCGRALDHGKSVHLKNPTMVTTPLHAARLR